MADEHNTEKENNRIKYEADQGSGSDEPRDDDSFYKQQGVKQVEAITTVWSKQVMIVMFVLLYLITFVDYLQGSVQGNLQNFITSSFGQHGLLAATDIVASIIGGVCTLTIAKVIDIWGRCEGFAIMILLMVAGMITKGVSQNVPTYAAGHTLYWVGHIGLGYIVQVVLADMTTLRNRLIVFGLQQTPNIATVFAGPAIAELFYNHVNFRWAFYAFCIILVFFAVPIAVIFVLSKRKAVARGIYPVRPSTGTPWQSTKHHFVEFDVLGMFFTVAGFSLLLLPFNLVKTAPNGWKTGYIIAMIVLGVVFLAAFVVWEKYFAKVQYFPWVYLKDRTVIGASLMYGLVFISIFITTSGYILNAFSLASSAIAPFVGLYIRRFGNIKYPAYAMIPFGMLGTALLIRFRRTDTSVGVLVMCQLFNGWATGVWNLLGQLGIMASIGHQQIAVALALLSLFGSIGQSIGFAISGALWTNTMYDKMYKYLPDNLKNETATIYGDISVQLSYERGTPGRDAIIHAYSDVQHTFAVIGSVFMALSIMCIFLWRNINVKTLEMEKGKQTKGMVF